MSISNNAYLNRIVNGLGKISNGKIKDRLIQLLYWWYRINPPIHVRKAKQYYLQHIDEVSKVENLLFDRESKEIYRAMIRFRSTYDMRLHPRYSLEDIYFVKDIIQLNKDETFIDCGAFDGDSIQKFVANAKSWRKIVAFEPDRRSFDKLEKMNIQGGGYNCSE